MYTIKTCRLEIVKKSNYKIHYEANKNSNYKIHYEDSLYIPMQDQELGYFSTLSVSPGSLNKNPLSEFRGISPEIWL